MKKSQSESKNTHRTKLKDSSAQIMLSNLSKKHSAFNDFYSDNKADINKININWTISTESKKEGTSSPVTDTIILKKYPKSLEDARIVAHEIEHLLIWKEGYPYVIADPHADVEVYRQLHQLAQVIQEPVFEPMVESRLKKYFKKLCSDNHTSAMKGLTKLIENKEKILPELNDCRNLLYYSCLYVQKCLLLESTCDKDKAEEYILKFNSNFGETILPCAEKILSLIKKNNTRSPESVKIILESILQNRKFGFDYRYQEEYNRFSLFD
ncbi:hypothetical protein [Methanoregula sp.]|jgi:hypothetical protein|uniref:hypothetical protein n=1 Tax=Methanoregula sp. TaxID=2052170 RepID=UPI0035668537